MKLNKLVNEIIPDYKKIIAYQNINDFSKLTLKFVGLNPTHKILLIGKKRRKKNSHKVDTKRNYESVALVLKEYTCSYIISFYVVSLVVALESLI